MTYITRTLTVLMRVGLLAGAFQPHMRCAALDAGSAKTRIESAYQGLPMAFEPCLEPNCGVLRDRFRFISHGPSWNVVVAPAEAVLSFRSRQSRAGSFRLKFAGASESARASSLQELPGKISYFFGRNAGDWKIGVPTYSRIGFHNIYPGIDLVYYGNQGRLEYDFEVAAGANTNAIRIAFDDGVARIDLGREGDLVLHLAGGDALLRRPIAYQNSGGARHVISARYSKRGRNQFGIELADYDARKALVVDPVLEFSTFLGGSGPDNVNGIGLDGAGNVYLVGDTVSADFPTTTGAFLRTCAGCPNFPLAFVTKLNPSGSALLYSTFIGGKTSPQNPVHGSAIAVDAAGNAYITGDAFTNDFPTTPGAFRPSLGGAPGAYAVKLGPSGAMVYSTLIGPAGGSTGIAIDGSGNAYIAGSTSATDFPVTSGAFQTMRADTMPGFDAFVVKLNPTGSGLVYGTYLGGSSADFANAIAVDATGNAYVTGITVSGDFPTTRGAFQTTYHGGGGCCYGWGDVFVTKLNPTGSGLVYSTYLGGNQGEAATGITVSPKGNAYVAGFSFSLDFPTTAGSFRPRAEAGEGYVAQLDPTGSALVYSTYIGATASTAISRIALDSAGSAHVAGQTNSSSFPLASPLQQSVFPISRAFLEKLNSSGSTIIFSTAVGGGIGDGATGLALDASGNAYVAGVTSSPDFPVTPGVLQTAKSGVADVFVAKISDIRLPVATLSAASTRFPDQKVGSTSSAQKLSLTNDGDAALNIKSIAATGDFRQVNSCPSVLQAGATCAIDLSFAPAFAGDKAGSLTIADNAYGNPHIVSLAGTGINPVPALVSVSPSSATAGGGAFSFTVNGSNFVPGAGTAAPGSVVRWKGADRSTVFVNGGQLRASIPESDLDIVGAIPVSVFNAAPGGGTSSTVNFTVAPPPIPAINTGGLVHGATFAPPPLAAGSIASVFGVNLAGSAKVADNSLQLPTALRTTSVQVNGVAAPLFSISPSQINIQIPWEASSQTTLNVSVITAGGTSPMTSFPSAPFAPGIFSMDSTGHGQGAVVIAATGEVAAAVGSVPGLAARPAQHGEYISIYCTGLGDVTNRPASGSAAVATKLSFSNTLPVVILGGAPATVSFSGLAPGYVGLFQVNVQVPDGAATGNAVPLALSIGGVQSNSVTIAVQ